MYEDEDERELIHINDIGEGSEFLQYCYCTKLMCDSRECSCRYISLSTCASPFIVLMDIFSFVPQLIINNVKLCFI